MTAGAATPSADTRHESFFRTGMAFLRALPLKLFAAVSLAARRAKEQWLTIDGVEFLRDAGVQHGDTVVDFGCGRGDYTIPAARLVGNTGLIASVDLSRRKLDRMIRRASADGLRNVRAAPSLESLRILLANRSCRVILLYDVLHFMDLAGRKRLYETFRQMLTPDGILSVHPKHLKGDTPRRYFRNMTIEDVVREIETAGFELRERKETSPWHGHGRVRGTMLTFARSRDQKDIARLARELQIAVKEDNDNITKGHKS